MAEKTQKFDRNKFIEEMKKKHDFITTKNKSGTDLINFDLGEVDVPKDFQKSFISIKKNPETGKFHIVCIISMGLSDEEKEKRATERKLRYAKIRMLKEKRAQLFKEKKYEEILEIDEQIETYKRK